MDSVTLEEVASITYSANILGKDRNPIIIPLARDN